MTRITVKRLNRLTMQMDAMLNDRIVALIASACLVVSLILSFK